MKKIIESLRSFYKEPFLKIVVYVDGSGYIGAINGKMLFEFDDLAKLEAHLTMLAPDKGQAGDSSSNNMVSAPCG